MATDHDSKHDELRDRVLITDLLDRFLLSLDERVFDEAWARRLFAEDVTSETPVGDVEGWDAIVAQTEAALAQFDRTQHVGANCVIDLDDDGDHARVRANLVMTHIHLAEVRQRLGERFVVGGLFDGEAARTVDGWRWRRVAIRPVWFDGEPPLRPGGREPETK
jgi:SnoaL-like protein